MAKGGSFATYSLCTDQERLRDQFPLLLRPITDILYTENH